jgi:D-sedoheptulose 7-phosphate isomerase
MKKRIQNYLLSSVENYSRVLNDPYIIEGIEKIVSLSVKAFKEDKKILFCGNGGSASDAQHIAAELSGRFYVDRPPLYAEALHVNSSFMTAVANDFGFDQTFARMLEACGRKGDILVGISTSGNSNNVVNALKKAKDLGMKSVGFTGKGTSEMSSYCDIIIKVPSDDTPRIQEAHILIGHVICKLIEQEMFPNA